ncbi:hypothetical protein E2C01_023763 [Portunus trituberculatus]|uniref:Uncharacterized protein n=1 Tax=Portunus trituberculatus TaxID=210409 RepID=A0A5B7EBE7_PORTR|nr:hypothetical protein [Portunus trituberculatus]
MRWCANAASEGWTRRSGLVTEARPRLPGSTRSPGSLACDLYFYLEGLQNDNIKVSLTPGTEKLTGPMLIFNIFWPSLHTKFNLNGKKHSNMKANSASKHRKIPLQASPASDTSLYSAGGQTGSRGLSSTDLPTCMCVGLRQGLQCNAPGGDNGLFSLYRCPSA